MWRTITRIRQSVGAFTKLNNESLPNSGHKPSSQLKDRRPLWLHECRHFKKFCCTFKSKNGEERRNHKARQDGAYYQVKHDWMDCFGWSGVLLLSWFICQPVCLRRVASNPAERYAYQRLAASSPTKYPQLVNVIANLIIESPAKYVLPTVRAVKSTSSHANQTESIREVCESLESAHAKVTRSLQNFLGTECMQAGKHDKAFAHFSEAAKHDDAPAIFNLAICYEMGLGTKQCFNKAADLYKRASGLGHATAMYNLGVFHVHGWGGVEVNEDVARKLFTDAAELGQIDAQRALNTEEDTSSGDESDSEEFRFPLREIEPKPNDLTRLWFEALNIKLNSVDNKHYERLSSTDSGVNDLFSLDVLTSAH